MSQEHFESRKAIAMEKKRTMNCAQAVACTYCDLCGLDPKTAEDMAGPFGGGMGNMEGTCGAIVGAGMILGLMTRDRNISRSRMRQLMARFKERNGATQCRMLKGVDTGVVLRECEDCVGDAAEFLEELI